MQLNTVQEIERAIDALTPEQREELYLWLDRHHPRSKPAWVKLFKETFRFTGGEIVGEFLMSLGYLPGAHQDWCPAYQRLLPLGPPWHAKK